MKFAVIDIIFALIVLFCVIRVTLKGFISEFFSKAALILGGLCAVLFYTKLTPVVSKLLGPRVFSEIVAFLLVFIGIYIIVKLIQQLVGSLFTGETLTGLDKALGFFWGLLEGVLLVAVLLILIRVQPFFESEAIIRNSIFSELLSPFLAMPQDALQNFIANKFNG